jgi:hypothetical protein
MHGRGEKSVQRSGGKAQRREATWKMKPRWKDGNRLDLREIGWRGGMNSTSSG